MQAHIQKFIRFLLNRYGKEEVESWFFEVWNEPDLKTPFFDGTQEEYFRLYEITVRAIKEVDDKLKVGGPATSNSKWVAAFVQHCKEHSLPVDLSQRTSMRGTPSARCATSRRRTTTRPPKKSSRSIRWIWRSSLQLEAGRWSAADVPPRYAGKYRNCRSEPRFAA